MSHQNLSSPQWKARIGGGLELALACRTQLPAPIRGPSCSAPRSNWASSGFGGTPTSPEADWFTSGIGNDYGPAGKTGLPREARRMGLVEEMVTSPCRVRTLEEVQKEGPRYRASLRTLLSSLSDDALSG